MSVGWIKTEEQRDRHKQGCRARYQKYLIENPDYLKQQYANVLGKLETVEDFAKYKELHRIYAKRSYMRFRAAYLKPDSERRETLVGKLGGRCLHCGYDKDVRALVLDHIRGDGHADRKRLGGKIARYYLNNFDEAKQNLQVLCHNCNAIKAIDEKEHNRSRRVSDAA